MLPSQGKPDGGSLDPGGSSRSRQEEVIAKHLHGKQEEWAAVADKKEPLQLLDLPVDVLQVIVKEVTHTNDLTSLALTHSALHNLAIPLIYSRFDIVWPDTPTPTENSRLGVDALTYGLATLVMAPDVFGEVPFYPKSNEWMQRCSHCNRITQCSHARRPRQNMPGGPRGIRRGNAFARYTQKFSLSNGPADWVSEYQINKESGKMLGTLVALAVGRMRNLETFVWDMPTGILRDIFIALASLANRDDGQDCRLERVWVRWHDRRHDNSDGTPHSHSVSAAALNPTLNLQGHATSLSSLLNSSQSLFQIPPYPRVEFPTFSILPPLKSLTVLDIDELPYAEEMCILIERSVVKMREMRLGLAKHAQYDTWVRPSESSAAEPPSADSLDHGHQPGGILELLFSGICDTSTMVEPANANSSNLPATDQQGRAWQTTVHAPPLDDIVESDDREIDKLADLLENQSFQGQERSSVAGLSTLSQGLEASESTLAEGYPTNEPADFDTPVPKSRPYKANGVSHATSRSSTTFPDSFHDNAGERSKQKLRLEILELERVPLAVPIMSKAIDWTRLHTLTLLGCRNHEQLWKALRRRFTPESCSRTSSISLRSSSQLITPISKDVSEADYPLKIRHLHTDMVSPSLIAFLKDTLAENSIESLFLQECPAYKSPVSIDMIYKTVVRRHRSSLKKLSIDSWLRVKNDGTNNNWRRWVFSRDLLSFITSGKMPCLRELGLALDYKDWHMFLQRLPNVTQLRSLYICRIAGHVTQGYDFREAALQICDIVSLRPELELCYLGIEAKCFEVLEYTVGRRTSVSDFDITLSIPHVQSDGESDEDDTTSEGHVADHSDADDSEVDMASSVGGVTDDEQSARPARHFKLREILFYDDKVAVFKARHGKL